MTDRGALSGVLTGVSFIAGIGGAMARSDLPYPRPGSDAADVRRYFTESAGPARLSATGQLVSAASLARFTLSVARLAGRSGGGAGALRAAAIAGGGLATASLATAGLCAAALSARAGCDEARAVVLHRRAFIAGGPVHGAGFGVLVGALGLAGRRTGELPAPLATAALAAAVPNVLSPLYLVTDPAAWLIPIGRFPGLIVSAIAGARLARSH
jgi:hypothetical protein